MTSPTPIEPAVTNPAANEREALQQRLAALRPQLHRYCARMTGSVIDAEDVVQDACIKALGAIEHGTEITYADAWFFRIAYHAALDFLRHRKRLADLHTEADWEVMADPILATEDRQVVTASLGTFMRLPVMQRSCVILMDVLGYSLLEIVGITESTLPAIKAALHRGRANLKQWATTAEDRHLPILPQAEQERLKVYIERFNARDFDAIREMLADDVRLDLVGRMHLQGRTEVGRYFTNYERLNDWHFTLGSVEQRLAILVTSPVAEGAAEPQPPIYFILLDWVDDKLSSIRDFYHGRYVLADADWQYLP